MLDHAPSTPSRSRRLRPGKNVTAAAIVVLAAALALAPVLSSIAPTVSAAHDVGAAASAEGIDGLSPIFTHPRPGKTLSYEPWAQELWMGAEGSGLVRMALDLATSPQPGAADTSGERSLWTRHDGLPSSHVHAVEPLAQQVWLGTSVGPVAWDRATGEFTLVDETANGTTIRDKVNVLHAEARDDGSTTVWVGTQDEGLFKLEDATGPLVPVPNPVNGSKFTDPILGIATDGPEVWIGADTYGLVEWHRDTGETQRHEEAFELIGDEPHVGVVEIKDEDVWVGTGGEGARKYNRTTEMYQAFANPDNLGAFSVYDLTVVGPEVWFATETGVSRYNYEEDRWRQWDKDNGFIDYKAFGLAAGDGHVWASTRQGVAVFDRTSDTWDRTHAVGLSQSPPWSHILDCAVDGDDIIFTTGGGGAATYTPATGQWVHAYPKGWAGVGGVPDILVPAVEPAEDTIWFGSLAGVAGVDRETREWTYYRLDGYDPADRIREADKVNDVTVGAGTFWVASQDWGLGRYLKDRDEIVVYNETNGLSDGQAMVVETLGDDVWVGTARGLDVVNAPNETVTNVYPVNHSGQEGDDDADGSDGDGDGDASHPEVDFVFDLVTTEQAVWAATAHSALVRVDPVTHEVERVYAEIPETVRQLLLDGDTLWAAGHSGTVYEVPLDDEGKLAGEVETHTGMTGHARPWCMVRAGDLIYIGTDWGIQRMNAETGEFLPQYGMPEDVSGTPATLDVSSPQPGDTVEAGAPVTLEGAAGGLETDEAAATRQVHARAGLGAWQTVDVADDGTFSVELPTDRAGTGDTVVTVRLIEEGDERASRTVPVTITEPGDDPGADGLSATHTPPLETVTEEPVPLALRVEGAPEGTQATLTLTDSAGETRTVPMEASGSGDSDVTRFETTLDPFEEPDRVTYTFEVDLPDRERPVVVPQPGDPFGDAYALIVRLNTGFVSLFTPPDPVTIETNAGDVATRSISIQNAGTRSSGAALSLAGEAADWIALDSDTVALKRLSTSTVEATVEVPGDVEEGIYTAELEIVPEAEPAAAAVFPLEVHVGDVSHLLDTGPDVDGVDAASNGPSAEDDGLLPVPSAPALWPLLAALGAAMIMTMNRRKGDGQA